MNSILNFRRTEMLKASRHWSETPRVVLKSLSRGCALGEDSRLGALGGEY